jgi:hypothetical protein
MAKKLVNTTTLSDAEFRRACRAYNDQRAKARSRKDRNGNPIEWLFTRETWIALWLKSGKWHQRGCRRGQYVMARFGDVGPYSPDNVEIKLHSENLGEGQKGRKHSEETKAKIGEAQKGIPKPKMACIHCGKLCAANMLNRYHNDNCRYKV